MQRVRKLLGHPRGLGFSSIERCKKEYLEAVLQLWEYEGGSGGGWSPLDRTTMGD